VSTKATETQAKSTPRKRGTATSTKATQEAADTNVVITEETTQSGTVAVVENTVEQSETPTVETEVLEGELLPVAPTVSGLRVSLGANDHQATMFTERTAPWMKMGKLVDGIKTAKEAAIAGGIDFDVTRVPTAYLWNGQWIEISNRRTIVRKDTGFPMSIVGAEYPVLQYSEAFDFMDQINPEYVAAGALKGGKQGFMVAKAPTDFELTVLGEDKHELFIVLRTSHDLTRAVEIMVMPLRGKCMNQLTLRSFTRGVDHRWAVRHTSTMAEKLAEAQDATKKIGSYAKEFNRVAESLAAITVNDNQARMLLSSIFPDRPRTEEKINRIITMMESSETVAYPSTGWGLVNAVSEYYDWERSGGSPESRFTAALQGQTHTAINKVATRVLSMA
jgi:phage/plasmid-like protein (TIGR03299 family)